MCAQMILSIPSRPRRASHLFQGQLTVNNHAIVGTYTTAQTSGTNTPCDFHVLGGILCGMCWGVSSAALLRPGQSKHRDCPYYATELAFCNSRSSLRAQRSWDMFADAAGSGFLLRVCWTLLFEKPSQKGPSIEKSCSSSCCLRPAAQT